MSFNPYKAQQAYKTTSIQTAGQGRLVIMLFEGAIRFMNRFADATRERRIEEAHNNSIKSQRIMTELILALDHAKGGDVSRVIEVAYEDIRRRMIQANIRKDLDLVVGIVADLESFRETWSQVFKMVDLEGAAPPPLEGGGGVSIQT